MKRITPQSSLLGRQAERERLNVNLKQSPSGRLNYKRAPFNKHRLIYPSSPCRGERNLQRLRNVSVCVWTYMVACQHCCTGELFQAGTVIHSGWGNLAVESEWVTFSLLSMTPDEVLLGKALHVLLVNTAPRNVWNYVNKKCCCKNKTHKQKTKTEM